MIIYYTFILLILASLTADVYQCNTFEKSNIKLVVTLFRHGDRTNDKSTVYPKDPYINEKYEPFGIGELKNNGKLRMYNLGQRFRKNYYRYLGFQYKPQLVLAMSSGHSRTTASLELFLAGLFPPLNTPLEWNSNLNWNPIQFKCDTGSESNKLFFSIWCPSFKKVFDAYLDSKYVQNLEGKYRKDYAYLSNSTGLNVQSLAQLSQLYFGLTSEKEWGFELPTWTNEFYPSYLQEAAIDNYKTLIATPEHNQLYGGPLLKNIIDHLNNTITDSLENPKIIVYSGHEINIVGLLSAMKVYNPHVPPYGACIVLELYDNDAVKVLYDDYTSSDFKELKIEGCESPCPFSAFVNLLKAHLPSDENTCMV